MFTENELNKKLNEFRELPGETEWLEFKEAKNDFSFKDLGKYFSALSNEANIKNKHSGWLIFGVSNVPTRDIVGTRYRSEHSKLESLKHEIAEQTNGLTFQDIFVLNYHGKRVLMFQIPSAPAGIPTSWQGHYYGRDGESLVALSIKELEYIRDQTFQYDWSADICPDSNILDLDENALSAARSQFTEKYMGSDFYDEIVSWDIHTFLDKAKVTRNGQITRTAILLLGKSESSHHLTPHPAQITWKLDAEEKAYEHFGPPFLINIEEVFSRIRNIQFRFQPFNQLIPVELT